MVRRSISNVRCVASLVITTLWLSLRMGDPCASVNPDTDYCICSDREYVYYKLDRDTLHLYYATADSAPKKNNFPLKVVNHDINIMKVDEFKRTYAKVGITRLEFPVDDTKKCG